MVKLAGDKENLSLKVKNIKVQMTSIMYDKLLTINKISQTTFYPQSV
jgi:hypothetical protein